MKKLLFALSLIFIGIFMVKAETIDKVAPQIYNINYNGKTNFSVGDKIKFKINASDDVSGIRTICLVYNDINNYENKVTLCMDDEYINGEKIYTSHIPKNVRAGEYYLSKVDISDAVYNWSCYVIDGLPFKYDDCVIKDFNIPNIILEGEKELSTPKLESLTYSKEINTGEKLNITAKITDGTEVENVWIMFGNTSYDLIKIDKYTYSIDILINKKEDLIFKSFTINDSNNSYIQYLYESVYNNIPDQYHFAPLKDGAYDVKVNGETIIKAPILKNITFSSNSIKVPGYLYAYFDVESNDIENLDIQMTVQLKNCSSNCGEAKERTLYKDENGKYYIKLGFDQYQSAGTYYVRSVIIRDSYKNQVTYADWTSEYEKVEPIADYTFEIVNDTNADITTSNDALDIIYKINNANDGSVISIDTSKSSKIDQKIFAAIKGTNKTISLESDGIRWIFNGKNIKNPKTIDILTNITLAKNYNKGNWDSDDNALIIDFKNNGVLPGKVLIRIKADWTFRNYLGDDNLTVYYMNKNNFDLIKDNVLITNDGYYEFYIDHNSTYVLSNAKINSKLIANDYREKLNNKTSSDEKDKTDTDNKENSNEKDKTDTDNKENSDENTKPNIDDNENSNDNSNENDKLNNDNNENSNENNKIDINNNQNKNEIDDNNSYKKKNNLYLYIGIISLIGILSIIIYFLIKHKKILVNNKEIK